MSDTITKAPEPNLVECPACGRQTPLAQITRWRICEPCYRCFQRAHRPWIEGKKNHDAEAHHSNIAAPVQDGRFLAHDGGDRDDHGHAVEAADFDFEAVEDAFEEIQCAEPDVRQLASELLHRIMVILWDRSPNARTAALRWAAFSYGLNPSLFGKRKMADLAGELGMSKQAGSKCAIRLQEKFGMKFLTTKSTEARQNMRAAQLSNHWRRRGTSPDESTSTAGATG